MAYSLIHGGYMNIFELTKQLGTKDKAIKFFEGIRWKGQVVCPYCQSSKTCKHHAKNRTKCWQCWNCHKSFSVTQGTIFHNTRLPLNKWFMLIALMLNAKKGLSACQAARDLGIRRPTVWSMMHRIRKAMETDEAELLKGIVEMDETYIGGKPRKGNDKDDDDKPVNPRGRGTKKTPVVGMVERNGSVKTAVASKYELKGKDLKKLVRQHIDLEETILVTDEYKGYLGMKNLMCHLSVNHQKSYVDGDVHTNTIESFWAILKRGIVGQFHKVSKKYLQNYLHEFEYRDNRRNVDSSVTFEHLLGMACVRIC
jgi:transposase-like protein